VQPTAYITNQLAAQCCSEPQERHEMFIKTSARWKKWTSTKQPSVRNWCKYHLDETYNTASGLHEIQDAT